MDPKRKPHAGPGPKAQSKNDELAGIPEREKIIWQDAQVRESLEQGIRQAAAGEVVSRGDFTQYADDEEGQS